MTLFKSVRVLYEHQRQRVLSNDLVASKRYKSLHTVKLSYKEVRFIRTFWLKGFFIRELYFPLVIICS